MDRTTDPVRYDVQPPPRPRNRLTVGFRPILALPHALLVGSPVLIGVGWGGYRTGALGFLALTIALLDWFAILFTGRPLRGLTEWKRLYLRWRGRALAYMAFLRDEYPPFGEGPYATELQLDEPSGPRDRLTVGFRPILVLPHLLVLTVVLFVWVLAAVISWLSILITGRLSMPLWRFGRDVMRYSLRVEAYLLLMHDRFPRFSLVEEAEPRARPLETQPA